MNKLVFNGIVVELDEAAFKNVKFIRQQNSIIYFKCSFMGRDETIFKIQLLPRVSECDEKDYKKQKATDTFFDTDKIVP